MFKCFGLQTRASIQQREPAYPVKHEAVFIVRQIRAHYSYLAYSTALLIQGGVSFLRFGPW